MLLKKIIPLPHFPWFIIKIDHAAKMRPTQPILALFNLAIWSVIFGSQLLSHELLPFPPRFLCYCLSSSLPLLLSVKVILLGFFVLLNIIFFFFLLFSPSSFISLFFFFRLLFPLLFFLLFLMVIIFQSTVLFSAFFFFFLQILSSMKRTKPLKQTTWKQLKRKQ